MKLIHVNQARSVWLFDVSDLNPTGRDFTEELVAWIKGRYSFTVAPDVKEVRAKAGTNNPTALMFQRGRFQAGEDSFSEIVSLAIHNDGFVVDTTSSTKEADRFLSDLLGAAAKEFHLAYDPEMVRKRLYVSVLIVKSEMALNTIHHGLAAFAEGISAALGNGLAASFQLAGLQFWTEPNDNGVHKTFTLAPQAGKAFSEHRYFSEAPLQTGDHFRLLEDLERVLVHP
jgi:hypothetical protein